MKKRIYIIITILALCLMVGCSSNTEAKKDSNALEKIKEKGELVMGTSADYPPMEWIQISGSEQNIVGVDVEIAKAIANDLGVKLTIKNMAFEGLLNSLKAGDLDIVLAGMVADEQRLKEVDFSEPYYEGGQIFLVRKGEESSIKSVDDLKGKQIGVQMGTVQQTYAEKNFGANITGLENNNNLIMELKNKTFDAIFMAELPAKQFAAASPDLAIIEDLGIPAEEGSAVAIKKGEKELQEAINKTIDKLKDKDQVTTWFNHYLEVSTKEINENK
ncbi:transporter substrate-binding domain-containing protein [Peptoniphilus sp. GNH]|nr:ABC transporter, substrate-binding protein, family 3 [Clostridiales bacterium KA00134]UHR03231.1 transporter substrate-binding domain-containing protein [Peptoniphilus sp. GNH]